jgi:hypothetical protein
LKLARAPTKAPGTTTKDFQSLENPTHHLIWKGATFMDAQTLKEIENVLAVLRKQEETIAELEQQRKVAKAELIQSLATPPPSVDTAGARQKWKAKDDALAERIKDANELKTVIDARIDELKKDQPKAFNEAIDEEVKRLENMKKKLNDLKAP